MRWLALRASALCAAAGAAAAGAAFGAAAGPRAPEAGVDAAFDAAASPRAPAAAEAFDAVAANRTLHLAFASFCGAASLQRWDCTWCKSTGADVELLAFLNSTEYGTQGYVGLDFAGARLVVAFRGSSDVRNWIEDADIATEQFAPAPPGVVVHAGFNRAYSSLRGDMLKALEAGVEKCPSCKVLFTGHSLGAAMALLAAAECAARGLNATLFNFGQPRVAGDAFNAWAAPLLGSIVRVVRERDVVPHAPPKLAGYEHMPREVWNRFDDSGETFVVCDAQDGEDARCSDSELDFSAQAHVHYLGFRGPHADDKC
ncbi:Alpha/Beta hydrolase protein [Pelagophyceae sp. CCMP2097]|nr:Alpha/Beta hydrolase protein [Pelagophyceae sp. CCMP2097]